MRKSEMTVEQLEQRSEVIQRLSSAHWNDQSVGNWFEKGLWAEAEASMEYQAKMMNLQVEYHAKDPSLYLFAKELSGQGILIVIHFEDKLSSLLNEIISFQDEISSSNYKEKVKKILKICPLTYAATGEGEDELIQLSEEEDILVDMMDSN